MSYDPFIKGEYPVGVRTIELTGSDDNYATEIWYPAADEYRGVEAIDTFKFVDEMPAATQEASRDAEPAKEKRPLVMYWHGAYGHRREMAAMCVFLASHGFVVAAPDFPGDNIRDMYGANPPIADQPIDGSAKARPRQAAEVIEQLATDSSDLLRAIVDGEKVGSFGLSLGGFTTLSVNAESPRLLASVAIAPAWGKLSPIRQMTRIAPLMRLDWKSKAASVLLAGEFDALVVLEDVRELFTMLPEPKKLVVLKNAGHVHWADNAEMIHEELRTRYASGRFPDPELDGPKMAKLMRPFSTLCPPAHATDLMRSMTLAHFESKLNDRSEAQAFLDQDLAGTFAQRGIDVEVSDQHYTATL